MRNKEYDNINELAKELKNLLSYDFSFAGARYKCAACVDASYEALDSKKHPELSEFLYAHAHKLEVEYPLEEDHPQYNEDIERYRENVKNLFEYFQSIKLTLLDAIPTVKFEGNIDALGTLIRFFEKAVHFDFSDVNNRYLCSAELWAFFPEVDNGRNPELYRFIEAAAEELDTKPLLSDDPYYNEEIEDYKNMVNYTLKYLRNCI